ncbi:Syntaxin-32 [Galdieria sulphuraria]|uniref:Syntaxin 5 isoform 1 n=1 Tax=Galdieria sulphuraria TaxID=130081 RepID=M2VXB1_GALSU|nr:syntaxin 5 isoform 1 [Galdieria sulphuraria]EME27881.1 syntaxin 5 isoform 1 [Galdieria sulphuraria]GJD07792.1 Syntaxin-32 [Galdieria sulphuraria]|eukprot:XP_005704401.1 syntaxin 5 isoform 1 [Galdieria sulphuraria]
MQNTNICDRTNEFLSAAQSYQQREGVKSQTKRTNPQVKSAFTKQAIDVAQGIESISKNLEKLTQLCQKSSLFDDSSLEIQQLTFVVKQQLHELNKQLEELELIHRQQRNASHKQIVSHGESVVDTLKTDLMNTTQEFKKVLQLRTSMLQKQQQRRQQFVASDSPIEVTPERDFQRATNGNSVVVDLGSGSLGQANNNDTVQKVGSHETNNQALMLQSFQLDNDYRRERAAAAQQIESTIVELGQIFQQLATMVSEQGELVERIDSNVQDTLFQVEQGQSQLLRYYHRISSNRWLIVKVFAIMLLFLFLWVVIL